MFLFNFLLTKILLQFLVKHEITLIHLDLSCLFFDHHPGVRLFFVKDVNII